MYLIVLKGSSLSTFKMDLEYNRVCRFIHMRTCYLPRGKDDMDVLRATLQTLLQLKVHSFFFLDKYIKWSDKKNFNFYIVVYL